MKQCEYYHHLTGKRLQCELCPHGCKLDHGQRGICHNRININGELYSDVYGHPCALAMDPIEKKPLFHFHPGSLCMSLACTGCNLRCKNCQNHEISQAINEEAESENILPTDIICYAQKNIETKNSISPFFYFSPPIIAFTYTEPLTNFEYIRDIAMLSHKQGMMNVLVSAGYISQKPLQKLTPLLDAANIDLKSFSDNIYRNINGATLQPVLDTLITLKQSGVWLEVTNLLIPTINDDMQMIRQMCRWLVDNGMTDNPLHFSRFFPMYKMRNLYPTPLDTLLQARETAIEEGIKYVYIGNTSDTRGEDTYCPHCSELLIKRDYHQVKINKIAGTGLCPKCGTEITGKW